MDVVSPEGGGLAAAMTLLGGVLGRLIPKAKSGEEETVRKLREKIATDALEAVEARFEHRLELMRQENVRLSERIVLLEHEAKSAHLRLDTIAPNRDPR